MNAQIPAIELDRLTKDFSLVGKGQSVRAVDELSVSVSQNSVFGLLGPNGSGKSTTIRILLGLSRPSSGKAFVFGENPQDPTVRRRVGFLPDAPYYSKALSGRELLEFLGKLIGLGRKERRAQAEERLCQFGLKDAMDRKLGGYSKGMLQRLGFAQALMGDPDLLILDEPTAGVDPVGAAAVGQFVLDQKAKGKTVLLCSHFLTQVQELCDAVGILHRGRLLASGSLDDLLQGEESCSYLLTGVDPKRLNLFTDLAREQGVDLSPQRRSLEDLFHSLIQEREGSGK